MTEPNIIAGYEISRSDFPIGNGSPCYQLQAVEGGTGLPCGWTDTQMGACAVALGAAYVQARLTKDPAELATAEAEITSFLANVR